MSMETCCKYHGAKNFSKFNFLLIHMYTLRQNERIINNIIEKYRCFSQGQQTINLNLLVYEVTKVSEYIQSKSLPLEII